MRDVMREGGMDWNRIANERLKRAEAEVRQAETRLSPRDPSSQQKYANALRELECARRFIKRVESPENVVEEAPGLFF